MLQHQVSVNLQLLSQISKLFFFVAAFYDELLKFLFNFLGGFLILKDPHLFFIYHRQQFLLYLIRATEIGRRTLIFLTAQLGTFAFFGKFQ